jgi:hypothetical protein
MKPIHAVLVRKLLVSKRFFLFLFILGALSAKAIIHSLYANGHLQKLESIVFDIYFSIMNEKFLSFLFIPVFLMMNGLITQIFDNCKVLLKFKNANRWWREKIAAVSLFVIMYTLVVNGLILGAFIMSGHAGDMNGADFRFFLFGFVMQFIGFMIIGTFYHFVVLICSHPYVGLLATLLIVIFSDVIKTIHKLGFTTLQGYMSLQYKWNSGEIHLVATDFIAVFCLVLVFASLYFMGATVSKEKDFYWSE